MSLISLRVAEGVVAEAAQLASAGRRGQTSAWLLVVQLGRCSRRRHEAQVVGEVVRCSTPVLVLDGAPGWPSGPAGRGVR
eukprot:13330417-Heterocapsa_arctica.AAC.1